MLRQCATSPWTIDNSQDGAAVRSTGVSPERQPLLPQRRRASYQIVRRRSIDYDSETIFLKLEHRLAWLEDYGNLKLDAGISGAYGTLESVRDSCSHVSGELIDVGRRRAKVLVEIVESRYNDVTTTRESLEAKAQAGVKLMEGILADLEARALSMRGAGLSGVVDEGWRRAEEGLKSAKGVVDEGLERARRAKDSLKESVDVAVNRAREVGLLCYDDLPHPWRINPHILRGYRFSETKVECIRSAFKPSNELVNIWTHVIGLLIVLAIAFYFYPTSPNFGDSSYADVFIAALFFFAACKCLVCSCMWHTMNSIADQTLMERFACVDYTGISLLIAASIMTTEYTAFYCEPVSRWTYISSTAILGVAGVILPWHPTFNRQDMAWLRVAFYVSLAATGFAPVIQLNLTRGSAWSYYFYAPILKSVLVYLVGAIIYAMKLPEKLVPGWFDYIGGSHNIWHVMIVLGILFHYMALQDFFSGAFQRAEQECSVY
ncbi:hypothetical protein MMC25_000108 [Agyrium rufum]|nr:hypothetical protein [Agyrium rufum]